jgi:hypothetical protein
VKVTVGVKPSKLGAADQKAIDDAEARGSVAED